VEVNAQADSVAPGYIFVAPKEGRTGQGGAMILDDRGQVVWFHPLQGKGRVLDFKAQTYQGRPVLTWKETPGGYVIYDDSYREIKQFPPGNGYPGGDHHEFLISPQNTALITIYDRVRRDLSPVGGPKDGVAWEGIVQELDIETGEVIFEWRSLDHVGLEESYSKPSQHHRDGIDYFHLNSIEIDGDTNLIISARETSAVYKIDRKSGEVMWRLGGKHSDFEMGPGTRFAYQHDARRQNDGAITIFDNGDTVFENGTPKVVEESRGIVLDLDQDDMRATLEREYLHQNAPLARSQGNLQSLPGGNVLIGYGSEPIIAEFSRDGRLLFDARLPEGYDTYRAYRLPWTGRPVDPPDVAVEVGDGGEITVYASWNGATEVAEWQVLAGPEPDELSVAGSGVRDGFETAIAGARAPFVAVRALDDSGEELAVSEVVEPEG